MIEDADTEPTMRIGELAAQVGLNPKTIRYYEELRLLPVPARTANGYRMYTPEDRERLRFIAKAKAIGLTLTEIRDILVLRQHGEQPCTHVLMLIEEKLTIIDAQLRTLMEMRQELFTLHARAATAITSDAGICRIIERHESTR
jgi:DNA-binding transcriptional MerR regulator